MEERLPEKVDVVILGTGLPEAILAAACARSGLSVLHLDRKNMEETLKKDYRKFSIDILPKVLLSKGAMVQTLCDSQVSQYAEFKLVDRQLCPTLAENEQIDMNKVPCSKGEIFTSTVLSMMEKRALMKFITFCTQWRNKDEAEGRELLKEYDGKSFDEFLTSMDVGEKLKTFIINTIGILEPRPSTIEGMKASCEFMDSVGHFGASPFLYPLYGCGELAQCFCRLAAVFGSLYCLGRPVQSLIVEEGKVAGVVADDQTIRCDRVIMSPRYVPEQFEVTSEKFIDRIVYVIGESVLPEEKEHISLINLAALRPEARISRVIEAGFEACTAPKGYYLMHITGSCDDSPIGVEQIARQILQQKNIEPIWRLAFRMRVVEFERENLAPNLSVSPSLDDDIHYSAVIEKCKKLFCEIWPDRDFLPRSIRVETEDDDDQEHETPVDQ
ncbi:unnamed protein product [Caenorhabditis bovis]|uniref:Rab proteins geranylgeranyltransferase component A n=1 Tax=Caenorhabditis bovis TaxID=2654633 RepID=A0A8S1ENA4_9PELO|nr:unnamed protein product [Caenorhabditis bovis]